MSKKPKPSFLRRWLSYRGRNLEITTAGWLFILLTLAVGFAAINSGSNLLHVLFGIQMGTIIASGMLSEAMLRRAHARRTLASPVHAGGKGAVRIELRNLHARADLVAVSVEDDDQKDAMGACAPVFSVLLGPGRDDTLHATVTMERRGLHRLPPAVVATAFPFGLFVKRRELARPPRVIVYPKVHAVELVSGEGSRSGDGAASAHLDRAGEFFGLAEYREGIELRRIHWPATARRGEPVVREFEAPGERERILHVASGTNGEPEFEARVEDAASLAVALLREGRVAVGFSYDSEPLVAPGFGPGKERELLEAMALVGRTSSVATKEAESA